MDIETYDKHVSIAYEDGLRVGYRAGERAGMERAAEIVRRSSTRTSAAIVAAIRTEMASEDSETDKTLIERPRYGNKAWDLYADQKEARIEALGAENEHLRALTRDVTQWRCQQCGETCVGRAMPKEG